MIFSRIRRWNAMRAKSARCVAVALSLSGIVSAQRVTDPTRLPAARNELETNQPLKEFPCKVEPVKPVLNFGLRLQAGYRAEVGLNSDDRKAHHWDVLFRVTPGGGQPVYFVDSVDLSGSFDPNAAAEIHGAFLLGAGRYDVKWMLSDDSGRVCRKSWNIDARADHNARSGQAIMPPNTAADFSWRPPSRADVLMRWESPKTISSIRLIRSSLVVEKQVPAADAVFVVVYVSESASRSEYSSAEMIATRDRAGRVVCGTARASVVDRNSGSRIFPAAPAQSRRATVQNCHWDLRYLGAAGAPVIVSSSAATAARKLSGITSV